MLSILSAIFTKNKYNAIKRKWTIMRVIYLRCMLLKLLLHKYESLFIWQLTDLRVQFFVLLTVTGRMSVSYSRIPTPGLTLVLFTVPRLMKLKLLNKK